MPFKLTNTYKLVYRYENSILQGNCAVKEYSKQIQTNNNSGTYFGTYFAFIRPTGITKFEPKFYFTEDNVIEDGKYFRILKRIGYIKKEMGQSELYLFDETAGKIIYLDVENFFNFMLYTFPTTRELMDKLYKEDKNISLKGGLYTYLESFLNEYAVKHDDTNFSLKGGR